MTFEDTNVDATDQYNSTPLHIAALRGNIDFVKCLVEKGAEIGATDQSESTPLLIADQNGHTDVVEFLRERSHN